jgi:CRP-like cAMP-binding protein
MNQTNLLLDKINEDNLWKKEISLKRNEFLKVNGDIDTNLYFIKSGSLRIFVMDETEENTIRFGYQNNIITALDSYITEKPTEYYIQAIKASELKVINKSTITKLLRDSPELQQFWNAMLEQIIIQQLEREQDILTTSPLKRYQRVLERSPQLFQEIPNKYIASYLRMSPETLSRLKKS